MRKSLIIGIPHPCGEDPNKMLPSANGSYCFSCKKEVIDFTGMSDSQLVRFFQNRDENICGRFLPDQLDKAIPLPKKQLPWAKYFFTIAIPAFLVSLKSSAQNKTIPLSHILSDHKFRAGKDVIIPKYLSVFTGRLVDNKGLPIEFASIQISNSLRGTATDQNGAFEVALHPGDKSISVSGVGIVTKQIPATIEQTGNIIVERSAKDLEVVTVNSTIPEIRRIPGGMMGGAISSITVTTSIYPAKINEISLYPNPVRSGGEINISWKDKVQADQLIEIFSVNGQAMQKETIRSTGKISSCSFVLKAMPPGLYVLWVIDIKTGRKISKEFIVL